MPRFVVLFHECPGGSPRPSHWDLMLETDGALRTWALARAPDEATEQLAERLPDHRIAYLDYEGPVAGDRGHVMRWDAGDYRELIAEPQHLVIELRGMRLRGEVTLDCDAADAQRLRFTFSPSR
ncbi:MAG: DNA polymerase ligase N-terminal domain-containing protein [Pirellulales bacterium]